MKLQLDVWQREQIRLLAGNVQGAAREIRKAIALMDSTVLTPKEKESVQYEITFRGPVWKRGEKADAKKAVAISDPEAITLLKRMIEDQVIDIEAVEEWNTDRLPGYEDLCRQLKLDFDGFLEKGAEKRQKRQDAQAEAEMAAQETKED